MIKLPEGLPTPDWHDKEYGIALYRGDCLEVMPKLPKVDAVVTDPPYPDCYTIEYSFNVDTIHELENINCRQLVFWTTKQDFPLSYTARHVWDKKTGCGSEYEFIYERNGHYNYKVVRQYLINSTVAASFNGEEWTGHKSQKPIKLMEWCLFYLPDATCILDPFMGSGTTGVASVHLDRAFIGIEKEPKYFEIAVERIRQAIIDKQGGELFAQHDPEQLEITE